MTELKPIAAEDLLQYSYPSALTYNPEGSVPAFTLTRPDRKKNGYTRSVWIYKDGRTKQMTNSIDASFVLWQDDETMIIRRTTDRTEAGTTDLFTLSIRGKEAQYRLTLPFIMTNLHKVHGQLYIAEGTINAEDPDAYLDDEKTRAEKRLRAEEEKDYQIIDEVPYWHNGAGFTNKERNALFMVKTGEETVIERVSEPYENVSSVMINGNDVYYLSETHISKESRNQDVRCFHTGNGSVELIYGKGDLGFSRLFMMHDELYGLASARKEYGLNETPDLVKITTDHVDFIVDPHRGLMSHMAGDTMLGSGFQFRIYNDEMYTLATDDDRVEIWKFNDRFEPEVLFDEPGAVWFLDVKNEKIVFAYENAEAPTELYEMKIDGSDMHRISDLNSAAVKDKYVALPEVVDFVSEGYALHGWVLKPIDYDETKKYPAVLDIHGGPRSIFGEIFFHEMQAWASAGYFVYFANIVGSDGRDDAFADIRGKYGTVDYRNLMDFTDAVIAKYPAIDETKLCVTGGSYGGFMTNWIIGRTDRFCAAASQRSIASWISLSFIADIGLWFDPGECGIGMDDNILDHFDKLWESSPLKNAKGVTTPTLFIHSDQDYRCPLPEGMQMMQALAYQNVETRMCIFHGENHEQSRSGKPLHRIRRIQEITNWFDKYTKEGKRV